MEFYNKVYDFTNENVSCLKKLYNFKNSKVLSVVGSGDQYFTSILYGAKQVDLFDINETSYLYLILKFYAIRELSFEEFYELFVLKNFCNENIYSKLEDALPKDALRYYKYLIKKSKQDKNIIFRNDGINLLTRKNQKYYFKNTDTVIPYFVPEKYYKLKKILKNKDLPKFDNVRIRDLKIQEDYDILLTSNIYQYTGIEIFDYVKLLKDYGIPEIQAGYDWFGEYISEFMCLGCKLNAVLSSSPSEYGTKVNYVYSLKK